MISSLILSCSTLERKSLIFIAFWSSYTRVIYQIVSSQIMDECYLINMINCFKAECPKINKITEKSTCISFGDFFLINTLRH